ncbi:hypothetical protein [Inquilinus sp. CAU 1745]|uniref:hypothetical protein n=1 Tax=Inquilinus sp. CAU 1745 TaxID=3140369 RepID=UPI00325AF5B6
MLKRTLTALILLAAHPAVAQTPPTQTPPTGAVAELDSFIGTTGILCESAPSALCVDSAIAFADRDGDAHLSTEELSDVKSAVQDWASWPGNPASQRERGMILLGLSMIETAGLDNLIAGMDTDGDGLVSRAELLADVQLDERPLGEVLLDPEAVDRRAIGRRFGMLAPMIDGFFQ